MEIATSILSWIITFSQNTHKNWPLADTDQIVDLFQPLSLSLLHTSLIYSTLLHSSPVISKPRLVLYSIFFVLFFFSRLFHTCFRTRIHFQKQLVLHTMASIKSEKTELNHHFTIHGQSIPIFTISRSQLLKSHNLTIIDFQYELLSYRNQ